MHDNLLFDMLEYIEFPICSAMFEYKMCLSDKGKRIEYKLNIGITEKGEAMRLNQLRGELTLT